MPTPFDSREYWQKRFEHEDTFEWLMPWSVLEAQLERLDIMPSRSCRSAQRVLNLGCGNSTLPLDLYAAGYQHVLSVDFVKEVVDRMRTRCQAAIGWKEEEEEEEEEMEEMERVEKSENISKASEATGEDGNLRVRGGDTREPPPPPPALPHEDEAVPMGTRRRSDLAAATTDAVCSRSRDTRSTSGTAARATSSPASAASAAAVYMVHTNGTSNNVPPRQLVSSTGTPATAATAAAIATAEATEGMMTQHHQQQQQQEEEERRHQCPLEFREMDCLDLSSLAPSTFDLILDKSTSDAIACGDDNESTKLRTLCEQVARVTKPGGVWCVVSYSQYRQYEFEDGLGRGCWTTERIESVVQQAEQPSRVNKASDATRPVVHQPVVYQYLYVNRRIM